MYVIGYFAKERGSIGKQWTIVYILKNNKPICGYSPNQNMQFQRCANGVEFRYVECEKYRTKISKLIKVNDEIR